jgi:hypothetical protein
MLWDVAVNVAVNVALKAGLAIQSNESQLHILLILCNGIYIALYFSSEV